MKISAAVTTTSPPPSSCNKRQFRRQTNMLNQPTIEKLHTMKMHGMADAFRAQLETTESHQLSFEERFALLVDQQWLWKENRALGQPAALCQVETTRRDRRCQLTAVRL